MTPKATIQVTSMEFVTGKGPIRKMVSALDVRCSCLASGAGAVWVAGVGDKLGTSAAAPLVVWACKPVRDRPAKAINKTIILISRMESTIASREHLFRRGVYTLH